MKIPKKKPERQIAIGDIHGCYDLLKTLVDKRIVFNPGTDQLIFMGDYIDRQRKSREVVRYVSELKRQHPEEILLLKGNHEAMAYDALTFIGTDSSSDTAEVLWYLNGGTATVQSYGSFEEAKKALVPFIESLELFYETDSHLFVHAGMPSRGDVRTATDAELLWDRSLVYDGHKTLVVGHTPVSGVTRIGNIICVDTGAFYTGILSGYDVLTDTIYDTKAE
jgi:serine/threonine protein phosphatase 1